MSCFVILYLNTVAPSRKPHCHLVHVPECVLRGQYKDLLAVGHERLTTVGNKDNALGVLESGQIKILDEMVLRNVSHMTQWRNARRWGRTFKNTGIDI